MQIDYCLILSAGFGTRMGEIGKSLPKVLWPVFERSLLELQVEYAKNLGVKKIFINLHHQKDQILEFAKNKSIFDDVTFLLEEEILDIGGGIHNLARQVGYKGHLLVLNADQFFLMDKNFIEGNLAKLKEATALLFSYQVDPRFGYNCLELNDDGTLKEIIPAVKLKDTPQGITYTGNSLINLANLTEKPGPSAFFDTVADYKKNKVFVVGVSNNEYWDFGTAQRYWLTMRKILTTYKFQSTHPFLRFLVSAKAIKSWKINLQTLSYHSNGKEVIHLGVNPDNSGSSQLISLSDRPSQTIQGPGIIYGKIEEKISL